MGEEENKFIYTYLNTLRLKGNLAYEYHPFHNYLTDVDLYKVDTDVGEVLVPKDFRVDKNTGVLYRKKGESSWVDEFNNVKIEHLLDPLNESDLYAKAGSLIDFETNKLNFDLEHPVDITIQPSYDGSVNLILNDNKNIPRLINSRFSVREKNTYEIVDRIGENDTNIYSSNSFDKDTSLYFQYEKNPIVKYKEYIKGVLPVGLYCFYITYCDSDDNESDYIAESELIPIFLGSEKDPCSMDGGIKNLDSHKGITLEISNLDKSYNYLRIYYVRYFADYLLNRVYECKKFLRRTAINSNILYLQITGQEDTEDLDPNVLNLTRFNPKSVLTQALCKNMLFFGNIVKNTDDYRELSDCALRIRPELYKSSVELGELNFQFNNNDKSGYYNPLNMTQKVGYFNKEYYRFGVVFIYNNGTLSNVYNTLGCELLNNENTSVEYNGQVFTPDEALLKRNYIKIDDKGWIINTTEGIKDPTTNNELDVYKGSFLNARGVCKINCEDYSENEIFGIKFTIPDDVKEHLKDLGIRGLFFVRQKCVPNILSQCFLMPMDDVLNGPVIEFEENNLTECFVNSDRRVQNSYLGRLHKYKNGSDSISKNAYAAICPDFLLNLPYFNQIFNSSKFRLKKITNKHKLTRTGLGERYYFYNNLEISEDDKFYNVTICSVTEDVPTVAIKDKIYRLNMGETEESFRFKYAEVDNGAYDNGQNEVKQQKEVNKSTNIVRGVFSPYLAIYSDLELDTSCLYNIYQEYSLDGRNEYQVRMDSSEPFYAISNRYNFEDLSDDIVYWRGDCYINNFAYRVFRNFNDPSLPNNDVIVEPNTWKDNYDITDQTKWADISRADLNAVQMGSWILFRIRSPYNYALRSEDHSYVSEEALMGAPRSFYPRRQMMWHGEHKMPDSYLYNDAYRATLGYKCYQLLLDINYIKNTFSNRILYSAIAIQDSYKNNYRYSLSTYFRDYSMEYGSITKLIGFEGYLLVIFEHAIAVAVINERILTGLSDGEPVFINTLNVLPEELTIISDTIGSLWGESIVKSEGGYVYGVDTISKKIWRVQGQQLEILSDMKVNKFLVDNITLGEREKYPFIGLKNVKSHYNNNKKDIMFTFYDDVYKDEEKVWNLCFNESMDLFITFYSWVPSYSENIDTQFFTFDRDTSKEIALLSKCSYSNPDNRGVLLTNPIFKVKKTNDGYSLDTNNSKELIYRFNIPISQKTTDSNVTTITKTEELKDNNITFALLKDHWKNNELFEINDNKLKFKGDINTLIKTMIYQTRKVLILYIQPEIINGNNNIVESIDFKPETIAVTFSNFIEDITNNTESLTTDFYLHGLSGLFDFKENVYPCYWYGKTHPFEFEFIVNDKISYLKIFTDLTLISNKAEPQSFHFEIEADNYDFSNDKRTMYFRQEATKELYLNLGSDIIFNRKYTDVTADNYTLELYYRGGLEYESLYNKFDRVYPKLQTGLILLKKSTIFPLYYSRVDTFNNIYDNYQLMTNTSRDYLNLSGSEITWNRDLNQFNVITHIKNSPIDKVGRLRGNSHYKEGKWNVQIPSITYMLKNEEPWNYDKNLNYDVPPLVVNFIPDDLERNDIQGLDLPNTYKIGQIRNDRWTYRKETKIRDKWIKIKIRYSGYNLAIIHSIITKFNISYGS